MAQKYWYNIVTPRKEVREGRSFNPDEFAIHLEQVVRGTAPEDYKTPEQFFSRTCFTRALREHGGMVLRRLAGKTENTAPVMTLITQFGGGKTHTLTSLYHLAQAGAAAVKYPGVKELLAHAGLSTVPEAKVAVFVGNAWDPAEGRETPWIDVARQLGGDKGVKELGNNAKDTPPGTDSLSRVFESADGPVLLLFDEVLNYLNRHRSMADHFHAFIQNLTVATTSTTRGVAVISLPRSQVEMTEWDQEWQDRISKVVRRVAKDLIANDEAEISEVIRRRLFENLGSEKERINIARQFADWAFQRRAQLPSEWTVADSAAGGQRAKDMLFEKFCACYPFHPATLSVFQRKWQALPQYQQTRGTLAMLAQWVSWVYRDQHQKARPEPLITLGSAPLDVPEFRSVVLGQLGETRLLAAIDSDIAGRTAHARALDADCPAALKDIHKRVGVSLFFESSGGQSEKVAHLPELRFALGEPGIDTTTIDNAAHALEQKSYFIRKAGTDGYRITWQATLKKVVNDRRASLDEEGEVKPAVKDLVLKQFQKNASLPIYPFPASGAEVPDSPKLGLVLVDPELEWTGNASLIKQVSEWMKQRGQSPRLYPASLVWCFKKPGRDLKEKVEFWLAWKRIQKEHIEGLLGNDVTGSDRAEIAGELSDAAEESQEEVWGGYSFVVLSDIESSNGLKVIDLGAGHSSGSVSLCERVVTALKSESLLNETVGAGFIDRKWPPALKDTGAWPLSSLRQSFLNGALTRLLDPDFILKTKIVEFVRSGEFGLGSGARADGTYERVWFEEEVCPDEVTFDAGIFLIRKSMAKGLKAPSPIQTPPAESAPVGPGPLDGALVPEKEPQTLQSSQIRVVGEVPSEAWNRLGTKLIPKLRSSGNDLSLKLDLSTTVEGNAGALRDDLRQVIEDLGLTERLKVS